MTLTQIKDTVLALTETSVGEVAGGWVYNRRAKTFALRPVEGINILMAPNWRFKGWFARTEPYLVLFSELISLTHKQLTGLREEIPASHSTMSNSGDPADSMTIRSVSWRISQAIRPVLGTAKSQMSRHISNNSHPAPSAIFRLDSIMAANGSFFGHARKIGSITARSIGRILGLLS